MTTKAIRLLYVVNDAGFFISHRLNLAEGAKAAGYDVHVATPAGPAVSKIVESGFSFHAIDIHRSRMTPLAEMRSFYSIYRLYRNIKPDIVHNVTIKPVIYGGIAARLARVPSVVSAVPGLGYVFISNSLRAKAMRTPLRFFYRIALGARNSKTILQNSDDCTTLVRGGVLKKEDVVLIRGSGVDVNRFRPGAENGGVPVVMLASRMLWDKGVGEFVEAACILRAEGVRARFVLVGGLDSCNPSAISSEQLKAWSDEGIVEWWGHRDDMVATLGLSHVVCLPSYREGLPKVLLEGASCGKPLVATDVPGCREVVVHGVNGLLVPPKDAVSLAKAFRRLIDDEPRRLLMGAHGRVMIEKEFSSASVVAETMALYRCIESCSREARCGQ